MREKESVWEREKEGEERKRETDKERERYLNADGHLAYRNLFYSRL